MNVRIEFEGFQYTVNLSILYLSIFRDPLDVVDTQTLSYSFASFSRASSASDSSLAMMDGIVKLTKEAEFVCAERGL